MKKLNFKLFTASVICAIGLIALIIYFGTKEVTPLPQWGLVVAGLLGVVMTGSLILFIIRKITGAEKWDDSI